MKDISSRTLKKILREVLSAKSLTEASEEMAGFPRMKTINALFGLLLSEDENLKWKAVTFFGSLVAELAQQDMEAARVVIRRLMWNLNDESGGIGWGAPEAMGESLARHEGLAEEYTPMLISYIREDGNFLELEAMQRGVLWALGRVAETRPDLVRPAITWIRPFLNSSSTGLRGHAVVTLGLILGETGLKDLKKMADDESLFTVFRGGETRTMSLKEAVGSIMEMGGRKSEL